MENKETPFEDYLKDEFAKQYHGLDDDMPDAEDKWFSELEIDYVIECGNKFFKQNNYG